MTVFERFTSFFRWRKGADIIAHNQDSGIGPNPTARKRSIEKVNDFLEKGTIGDSPKTSEADSATESRRRKRIKSTWRDFQTESHTPPEQAEEEESHEDELEQETAASTRKNDRKLMPPPAMPKSKKAGRKPLQTPSPQVRRVKGDHDENGSVRSEHTASSSRHRPDGRDDYEAERARRWAAAHDLPEGSGVWSKAEHELFLHLAMRGYEPVVPNNWMRDFKTFPMSLFSDPDEEESLIRAMSDQEFRAIRALRDLIETGKQVRDKKLASPGYDIENTLLRAITSYMQWAMHDAGIKVDQNLFPVHRFAIRKKGQRTNDLIGELEDSLSKLAQLYRNEVGILPSVEAADQAPVANSGEAMIQDEEDALPTLLGLMLVSGVLVIFTFNPNIAEVKAEPGTDDDDEEMSLRYIAKFDFFDKRMDVWNALSVAIACMMVRKIQIERGVETRSLEEVKTERHDRDDPDL